jgi:hypothetical protein
MGDPTPPLCPAVPLPLPCLQAAGVFVGAADQAVVRTLVADSPAAGSCGAASIAAWRFATGVPASHACSRALTTASSSYAYDRSSGSVPTAAWTVVAAPCRGAAAAAAAC